MRVGVYVDGFNLYFGGRSICGRSVSGWRWLDLCSLAESLIGRRTDWQDASVNRIAYCTALIDGAENRSGRLDQDAYLKALEQEERVRVELGYYSTNVKVAPLATSGPKGRPMLTTAAWPVMVKDLNDHDVSDARFMVSYARREEKGSDVNVATHLLVDALQGDIDAAVVVSNDSDLALPVKIVRTKVPVGLVNPSSHQLAGALRGESGAGVGRHWWYRLTDADFRDNQLPNPCGTIPRPAGW